MQISAINNYASMSVNNLQKQNLRKSSNAVAFEGAIGHTSQNKSMKTLRNLMLALVAFLAMACSKQEQPQPPQQPSNYENPNVYVDPLYINDPEALYNFYAWYEENCPECLRLGYTGEMPANVSEIALEWGRAIDEWWFTYNATHNNDGNGNP